MERPRRHFQFSLKALIIAVLIAGVLLWPLLSVVLEKVNGRRYGGLTASVELAPPGELVNKERLIDYMVRSTSRTREDLRQWVVEVKPVVSKDGTPALSLRYDKWALGDLPARGLGDILRGFARELCSEAGQPNDGVKKRAYPCPPPTHEPEGEEEGEGKRN